MLSNTRIQWVGGHSIWLQLGQRRRPGHIASKAMARASQPTSPGGHANGPGHYLRPSCPAAPCCLLCPVLSHQPAQGSHQPQSGAVAAGVTFFTKCDASLSSHSGSQEVDDWCHQHLVCHRRRHRVRGVLHGHLDLLLHLHGRAPPLCFLASSSRSCFLAQSARPRCPPAVQSWSKKPPESDFACYMVPLWRV